MSVSIARGPQLLVPPALVETVALSIPAAASVTTIALGRPGFRIVITRLVVLTEGTGVHRFLIEDAAGVDLGTYALVAADPPLVDGDGSGVVISNPTPNSLVQFNHAAGPALRANVSFAYLPVGLP